MATITWLGPVYEQASQAGASDDAVSTSASAVFEQLRPRVFDAGRKGWRKFFPMRGRPGLKASENLRYLMACLDETNRGEAMRLRVEAAINGTFSPSDLDDQIARSRAEASDAPVMAYAFA